MKLMLLVSLHDSPSFTLSLLYSLPLFWTCSSWSNIDSFLFSHPRVCFSVLFLISASFFLIQQARSFLDLFSSNKVDLLTNLLVNDSSRMFSCWLMSIVGINVSLSLVNTDLDNVMDCCINSSNLKKLKT